MPEVHKNLLTLLLQVDLAESINALHEILELIKLSTHDSVTYHFPLYIVLLDLAKS